MDSDADLRLNLSFVLHESLDSATVVHAADASRRFLRKKSRLLATFHALTPFDLSSRVVISPPLRSQLEQFGLPNVVVTATIGLPELLVRPEVFRRDTNGNSAEPRILRVDQPALRESTEKVEFFRAPCNLLVPPECNGGIAMGVLALLVRPDQRTLLLDGEVSSAVTASDNSDNPVWNSRALRTLERLIRDHHVQWIPPVPLWSESAVSLLPEFACESGIDEA